MKVKCDVVNCINNLSGECLANEIQISLNHDEMSLCQYIECETYKKQVDIIHLEGNI
jgi:hypothetical protein